ncbi:hypothetical protein LSUB1_G007124 [Lachnellula subtilissima]|uniref:Uncharacterized protein n=1 Tax=Lachnellula subtilissima TaxID=602034 RepID=A0A8H8RCG2_9HELO|nr:hypothetical protein LSUB1_G007124 [Lachnellula subtilissima]
MQIHIPNLLFSFLSLCFSLVVDARYVMYLTGQHQTIPSPDLVEEITHVAIAFMPSGFFNQGPDLKANLDRNMGFPLWTSVDEVRKKF